MSTSPLSSPEATRHALLADLAEHAAKRLVELHGMDTEAAADVGNSLADFLADHWKGQMIYFPADQAFKLHARDWEIFRRLERGNAAELAKEYGISLVRVHQIYRRCLAEYRARTQNSLFPAEHSESDA